MESVFRTLDLVLIAISVQRINNNIQGNNIAGLNIGTGAYVVSPRDLDATNNWWGSPDGPSGDGPGSGDAILLNGNPPTIIEFTPFLLAPPIPCSSDITCQQALAAALQQALTVAQQEIATLQQALFICQHEFELCREKIDCCCDCCCKCDYDCD